MNISSCSISYSSVWVHTEHEAGGPDCRQQVAQSHTQYDFRADGQTFLQTKEEFWEMEANKKNSSCQWKWQSAGLRNLILFSSEGGWHKFSKGLTEGEA